MTKDARLIQALNEAAKRTNEKLAISCAACFRLATKFKISLSTIGRICNRRKIKIRHCRLGCFK